MWCRPEINKVIVLETMVCCGCESPSIKYQVPSTKYQVQVQVQVPSTKYQVPSTKYKYKYKYF